MPEGTDKGNETVTSVDQIQPVVRPPRKLSKPTIKLKMPPLSPQLAYNTPGGLVTIPITPAAGFPPNYPMSIIQAYPNKAQEFMFKQFSDFKDFTMNTGKLGLSFGEKFAFWMYGKVSEYSKSNFTHILLLAIIVLYCALGGVLLYWVEAQPRRKAVLQHQEQDYKIGNKTINFICGMVNNQNCSKVKEELLKFKNHFFTQYHLEQSVNEWGLLNSIYLCGTIFTTIGYGHIAPATTIGRIITIIYSLFGIPLFLILLADYGKLFTRVIKFFWAYVRRLYYTGSCRKVRKTAPVQEVVKGVQLVFDMTKIRKSSSTKEPEPNLVYPTSPSETPALSTYTVDDEFNLPISVAVSILLLYMLSGAALFMKLEKWPFFESFYFVYISVSTIGFGDIVPSSKISVLLCSLVYFVFGLSLTSMCINVITEKLTDSFRQATAKIGATMGMEAAEDSINNTRPDSVDTE